MDTKTMDNRVYDLGNVDEMQLPGDPLQEEPMELFPPAGKIRRVARRSTAAPRSKSYADPEWSAIPSLFVPGGAQMLRGDLPQGLCLMTLTGFALTLAWAVYASLDRLAPTLELLGVPGETAVWLLGLLGIGLAVLHVAGVYGGARPIERRGAAANRSNVHPAVAGTASGILPGLGQLLNGDRARAAFLLTGLWLVAGSWALVTPWMTGLLASQNLVLPSWLHLAASPAIRWTLPAVLWTLGIYDAAVRANIKQG